MTLGARCSTAGLLGASGSLAGGLEAGASCAVVLLFFATGLAWALALAAGALALAAGALGAAARAAAAQEMGPESHGK